MDYFSELSARFADAADFTARELTVAGTVCTLCFLDGLVSGSEIGELVIRPLEQLSGWPLPGALLERAVSAGAQTAVAAVCKDVAEAEEKLLTGFCLLIVPGAGIAAFETKTGEKRGPSEPEVESTTRGPKDAFTETARTNTGLLRRHLRTSRLRLWETSVGRESRTGVSLLWLEGLTDPETVRRMQHRLASIDTEDLLTPAAVEHVLPGKRRTAFPLLQYTERTDKFAAGLLAGRVGLFVDGLPVGYLAPVNLGYLLEAAEDKDTDYLSARFLKLLRLVALACALLLAGPWTAWKVSPNTYLMKIPKADLPQYRFAEIIRGSGDQTLLNSGFLDGGFYFASGVLPSSPYFCTLNIGLPEMEKALQDSILQGKTEFVVTRSARLRGTFPYRLADEASMFFEGREWTYYLYQRREGTGNSEE